MEYKSRAVRALVMLQEQRLREFMPVWKNARAANTALPTTDNPSYQSLEALLRHVLGASRGYLTWVIESLGLADSGLPEAPAIEAIAADGDGFVEQLLTAWKTVLTTIEPGQLRDQRYRWHALELYVEMLLEHAVVHPQRHRLQLEELISA